MSKEPQSGHNLLAGDRLKSIVERVEHVESEIKELQTGRAEIYQEAKSAGLDVKAIKKIVAIKKQDQNKRAEAEVILATYMAALGMTA